MKLKKFRAVLKERPWLLKSIGRITGTHAYDITKSGGNWEKHLENWSVRNIFEITVHAFEELNLCEKAEFIWQRLDPPIERFVLPNGYGWRRREAFTHTEFHMFNRSTYDTKYSEPYAYCWVTSSIYSEGEVRTVRQSIHHMRRPHNQIGTHDIIETPYVFDAIVRITKVGIVGRCSSTSIDIFPFPADFDFASV